MDITTRPSIIFVVLQPFILISDSVHICQSSIHKMPLHNMMRIPPGGGIVRGFAVQFHDELPYIVRMALSTD